MIQLLLGMEHIMENTFSKALTPGQLKQKIWLTIESTSLMGLLMCLNKIKS